MKQIDKILGLLAEPASSYGFESDLLNPTKIRTLIKDKLKVSMHRTTVYQMFTEQNYSSKKPVFRWKEADLAKQKLWIKNTIPAIKSHVSRHKAILYFVNESAISLSASNGRTWGPVGQTT